MRRAPLPHRVFIRFVNFFTKTRHALDVADDTELVLRSDGGRHRYRLLPDPAVLDSSGGISRNIIIKIAFLPILENLLL